MASYLPRLTDHQIKESMRSFGGVLIQGPRACGKTSTGLQIANSTVYLDAEPQLADLAQTHPSQILEGETPAHRRMAARATALE